MSDLVQTPDPAAQKTLDDELSRADQVADVARARLQVACAAEREAVLGAEILTLARSRDALVAQMADLQADRDALHAEIGRLRASRSWRWTRPLRALARITGRD